MLGRLWEQFRQLHLIDSHEEAGNLTPKTAARYRLPVLRGGSIFGFPLDGPNAPEFVERWNETALELARDSLRFPNVRAAMLGHGGCSGVCFKAIRTLRLSGFGPHPSSARPGVIAPRVPAVATFAALAPALGLLAIQTNPSRQEAASANVAAAGGFHRLHRRDVPGVSLTAPAEYARGAQAVRARWTWLSTTPLLYPDKILPSSMVALLSPRHAHPTRVR